MTFIAELREAVDRIGGVVDLDVAPDRLPVAVAALSDESLRDLLSEAGRLVQGVQKLQAVLAGVASKRSTRARPDGGFAVAGGHRTPVELIRDVTGVSRAEAIRAVRVGESLLEAPETGAPDAAVGAEAPEPWHAPLRDALLMGRITQAQHRAIHAGLGAPRDEGAETITVWRVAAEELIAEADQWTVEQLAGQARTLRDMLDPDGAADRGRQRFERRSLRHWTDADGVRRASVAFDDEMGLWFEGLFDAALRPRRGGPRFVAEADRAAARALTDDSRSNDQLAYDLFVDVLRAGALAEARDVFGTREPGVRLVVMKDAVTGDAVRRDAFERLMATAYAEDGGQAVSGAELERAICLGGTVEMSVDNRGSVLDVGRERRLFTQSQRMALAARDGGCMWPGCDRPPSYCEAHHCTPWSEGGRTDCGEGLLLCRFHHLNLHNHGWRITVEAGRGFELHPTGGPVADQPIVLRSKSPLRWLWDPPPDRARWRTVPAA